MRNNTQEDMGDVVKMTSVAKEEKISAPVILAVISGSLILIGGVVSLVMMVAYHTMYGGPRMFGMMYGGLQTAMPQISPWIVIWSISSMICGIIILYCSHRLHTAPLESRVYGIVILIVSAFGIFAGHGFWVGSLFGIIAGIMSVSRK